MSKVKVRSIRVAIRYKVLHQAVNVLLAAAVLTAVVGFVIDPSSAVTFLADLVIIFSTSTTLLMQRRNQRHSQELGQWQERQYVINSMLEASHRGMTAGDWAEGYMERIKVEAEPEEVAPRNT